MKTKKQRTRYQRVTPKRDRAVVVDRLPIGLPVEDALKELEADRRRANEEKRLSTKVFVAYLAFLLVLAALVFFRFFTTKAEATYGNCEWVCERKIRNICVDWERVCTTPTSTPTPTATPTPVVEPSVTPEPTPEATPEPTPVVKQPEVPQGPFGAPELPKCEEIKHAPTITKIKYLGNQKMALEWSKVDDFVNTYLIWYGPTPELMLWNTFVTGNYTEIGFLQPGHTWFKVAGTHNSCVGRFSLPIDPVVK